MLAKIFYEDRLEIFMMPVLTDNAMKCLVETESGPLSEKIAEWASLKRTL